MAIKAVPAHIEITCDCCGKDAGTLDCGVRLKEYEDALADDTEKAGKARKSLFAKLGMYKLGVGYSIRVRGVVIKHEIEKDLCSGCSKEIRSVIEQKMAAMQKAIRMKVEVT